MKKSKIIINVLALLLLLLNECTLDIWPTEPTSKPTVPVRPFGPIDVLGMDYLLNVESYYYAFATYATDPDNDKLVYQFSVNNNIIGSNDNWSLYLPSGDTIVFITSFKNYGKSALIKARTKDLQGNISSWSEPLSVKIHHLWDEQFSGEEEIYSIYFIDENNGWASGSLGAILKTTNGGDEWINQVSGEGDELYAIYFLDKNTGWTVGTYGTILNTTDGGTTWHTQNSGLFWYEATLLSIYFKDYNNGWIVGTGGLILNTTNGGINWKKQVSGITENLHSTNFIDNNNGWAVGKSGVILTTTNGGNDWSKQSSSTTNELSEIYFVNSNVGWAVGLSGTILKTINSGNSWEKITSETTNNLFSVYFIDENIGWIVGENIILRSTDGGNSWTEQAIESCNLVSVRFVDVNTGWVAGYRDFHYGYSGIILKTTFGGILHSFTNRSSGETVDSLYMNN